MKTFICEKCGSSYTKSSGLARHKKIHQEELLHSCLICGKNYRRSDTYKKHLKTAAHIAKEDEFKEFVGEFDDTEEEIISTDTYLLPDIKEDEKMIVIKMPKNRELPATKESSQSLDNHEENHPQVDSLLWTIIPEDIRYHTFMYAIEVGEEKKKKVTRLPIPEENLRETPCIIPLEQLGETTDPRIPEVPTEVEPDGAILHIPDDKLLDEIRTLTETIQEQLMNGEDPFPELQEDLFDLLN